MGHKLKIKCVQCARFSFNKCRIYTHDGASAKFSTNSQETDNMQCTLNVREKIKYCYR